MGPTTFLIDPFTIIAYYLGTVIVLMITSFPSEPLLSKLRKLQNIFGNSEKLALVPKKQNICITAMMAGIILITHIIIGLPTMLWAANHYELLPLTFPAILAIMVFGTVMSAISHGITYLTIIKYAEKKDII